MQRRLLQRARIWAAAAQPDLRAAAMLRIARVLSHVDVLEARQALLDGLQAVEAVSGPGREQLVDEARETAAAVDPTLLSEMPQSHTPGAAVHRTGHVVPVMVAQGHVHAAVRYLLQETDPLAFPFPYVGNVLDALKEDDPESAEQRLQLLRHVVDVWRLSRPEHPGDRTHFVAIFGAYWSVLPEHEACSIAREILDQVSQQPDRGISADYMHEFHFSSLRQHIYFRLFHVLLRLDPALAELLLLENEELATAVRRYPRGLETMNEEAAAEQDRRKGSGEPRGGGFIFAGDPKDFASQSRLMDAIRVGDFAASMQDAVAIYREDISSVTPNHASKAFWPSTGFFRRILYQAGRRIGTDAERLLEQVPEKALWSFAAIELAAALAGAPEPLIRTMRQPRPVGQVQPGAARSVPSGMGQQGAFLQSSDGRQIRCPKCLFRPPEGVRWTCRCGHLWNTFWTAGRCPACRYQWESTQCPSCGEMSEHTAWYVDGE